MADIVIDVLGLPMLAVDQLDGTYSLQVATVAAGAGFEEGDQIVDVFGLQMLAKLQADGTYALVVAT